MADPLQPILLLGTGGMLHRAWVELLASLSIPQRSISQDEMDLTRPESIAPAIGDTVGTVINCMAYTNVDGAESDEPLAAAVNGTGTGILAELCRQRSALLVHYSTDYVFDGTATRPYPTDAPRNPAGAYGRTKALGEELVEQSGCDYLILRTSWLYAPWGKNFVRTIAAAAKKNAPLKVVHDQRGRPTSAEALASASLKLIRAGARGFYHVTDAGECSWCEFAREIVRHVNPALEVTPCSTSDFPRPAPRPAYSVLDISRTEALIGPLPHWTETLAGVMPRLEW